MYILPIMFINFIFIGLYSNLGNIENSIDVVLKKENQHKMKDALENFEAQINEGFSWKLNMVDVNGLFKKIAGQKIVNKAILGSNNKVYSIDVTEETYDQSIEDVNLELTDTIINYAENQGAEVIYVQHPDKFDAEKDTMPYDKTTIRSRRDDYWVNTLRNNGYRVLDLREDKYKAKQFYKTDHHWTNQSSLNATKAISDYLNIDSSIYDISNYNQILYKKSFLGSAGVRTGQYYVGKDDFTLLLPKFDTSLQYKHLSNGEETTNKSGNFKSAFINTKFLMDENYRNKYNVFLSGENVEHIIQNDKVEDGKLLLISDSFARPMVQYLSLSFHETRYLDPQDGRYNKSYIKYISEYKPDVVLIMFNYGYSAETIELDSWYKN